LAADPHINGQIELACFEYPTGWFEFNFLRHLPSVRQVAHALIEYLERRLGDYDRFILVGHSQGGLVIQSALIALLHSLYGEPLLERIWHVILIATPNLGSTTLSPLRKLLSLFYFFNQQERSLRVFDEEIDGIRKEMQVKVVETSTRTAETWPIPIQCFYGLRDRIVPEASARGPFIDVASLDGDHFSVLHATNEDNYAKIRDAIVDPAGHWRIWEIESYQAVLRVEPYEAKPYLAEFGQKTKMIRTNNVAHFDRYVSFAKTNRCQEPFVIRYRTRQDGFIKPLTSTDNEATPHELGAYLDYGTEYHYRFTPRSRETYSLELEVYQGFDVGNQDLHLHLGQQCRYKTLSIHLDLTAYEKAGHRITSKPMLYFHTKDPGDHGLCQAREKGVPIQACADAVGTLHWELHEIRDGVVDIIWQIEESAKKWTTRSPGALVRIKDPQWRQEPALVV
jgi:pimeloyl-ACP methyl ester carboxylesterase